MRHIVLFSTMALAGGLFGAGLAIGAGQQVQGQPRWGQGAQVAQMEQGIGTVSGETQQVQKEYQELTVPNLNENQIREMQKLLAQQGYDVGMEEGVIGPQTKEALRNFQQSQGITVTGNPDAQTLKALAPSAKQQEFFGIAPKFGEEGKPQPMEPQPQEQGVGPGSGQSQY